MKKRPISVGELVARWPDILRQAIACHRDGCICAVCEACNSLLEHAEATNG